MTTVMVVPADRGGCGYYRLVWPAQAVSSVRPDWNVVTVPPEMVQAGFRDGKFIGVRGIPREKPDLLVMQRVGTPGQYHVLKWAHENGIATVVDYDDAMWCIDKSNSAWRLWNLPNEHRQHWRWCDSAVAYADLVTVTTPALEQRYGRRHRRTEVIPNYVPEAAVRLPKREKTAVTAGWAGFTQTHPGDCRVSAPAARAVLDEGGQLCVIADADGATREWGLERGQVNSIPSQRLGEPYFESLSALNLMLVGLRDTPFNRAKSTLKVLEAAAAGATAIAPDNPPHRLLQRAGFPVLLAASAAEWADHARQYVGLSDAQRAALSGQLLSTTLELWTIEANAEQWAVAWERAMRRAA